MSATLSIGLKLTIARLAKNLIKSGGILSRKRKVVVFDKFCIKSDGFALITLHIYMGIVLIIIERVVSIELPQFRRNLPNGTTLRFGNQNLPLSRKPIAIWTNHIFGIN
jgi:hypothetical protein